MEFKIGFTAENEDNEVIKAAYDKPQQQPQPHRSVVQVYFSQRNMNLAYYNDRFDLHRGDTVYVEGKLAGMRGLVTDVNYNFKIKVSDYMRVIAVADTNVSGNFFMANAHFVTFDRETIPSSKVMTWFKAPRSDDDEIISGSDGTSFCLNDLSEMNVDADTFKRGHEYYVKNKVVYISIDGGAGYAIVSGREYYEIEFEYRRGEISTLVCSCYCSNSCKHEVAAMLQLKETLEVIEKNYAEEYAHAGYFAAIDKGTLFSFAIEDKQTGSFTLR